MELEQLYDIAPIKQAVDAAESQTAFYTAHGINRRLLQQALTGRHNMTLKTLWRFAEILGIHPCDLLKGIQPPWLKRHKR